MKTVYYYQNFCGLKDILNDPSCTDVIIVSSLHFDVVNDETNIYLNDNEPYDKIFNNLWEETKELQIKGVKIMFMMGGAGGAYGPFFNDYEKAYPKLIQLIKSKPWISGIDLDIEEEVDINNVRKLIEDIKGDLGKNFTITMAPVGPSLMADGSGMGGFSYKDLYKSHGNYISWFNAQCYGGSFSYQTYNSMVKNGYPEKKIVMGMMSGDFTSETFKNALNEVNKIKSRYNDMGGVYDWEYIYSPPNMDNPTIWAKSFKKLDTMWNQDTNYLIVNENKALSLMHKYVEINDISPRRFKYLYCDMIRDGYSFIKINENQKKNLLIELRYLLKEKYPLTEKETNSIRSYMLDDNTLTRTNSFECLLNTWELILYSDDD